MTLKLIPDDNALLVTPQPVAPAEISDEMITEEQARIYLRALSTPRLDAFRAKVLKMKTSELLGCSIAAEHVASLVCVNPITQAPTDDDREALMAAMLAVGDEIDRRVPVPR